MLCRVAEDVFWVGRYVERAIAVGRLIDVTWHLELDAGEQGGEHDDFWAPLMAAGGFGPGGEAAGLGPREIRHRLAFDGENPSSLVSCIRRARAAARGVRESTS